MKHKILIVDDEQTIRFSMKALFENKGYETFEAADGESALSLVKGKGGPGVKPDIVLLDVQLPDMNGLKVLQELKPLAPDACVIIVTGFGSVPQSVEAMCHGAIDYVLKPFNVDDLMMRVTKALENRSLKEQVGFLKNKVYGEWDAKYAEGPNAEMRKLYANLELVAKSPSTTVFIHGETGSGKEVIARRIHELSNRTNRPFVEVNATALSAELLESELFGHEAGSFTGATTAKKGLFEVADGGTLFLDEIGDMDLRMQAKLLRAIQERTIRRVGGTENIPVDLRLITATNRDLAEIVAAGEFREDLYYRLNVVPIHLPALRQRKDDIETLVRHFIRMFNNEFGKHVTELTPEAIKALMAYDWPGNIRELRNLIERTVLLECTESVLDIQHLKFSGPHAPAGVVPQVGEGGPMPMAAASSGGGGLIGTEVSLETVERHHIEGVLGLTGGNKNKAAQILGIDRTTLYNKLKKYEIKT